VDILRIYAGMLWFTKATVKILKKLTYTLLAGKNKRAQPGTGAIFAVFSAAVAEFRTVLATFSHMVRMRIFTLLFYILCVASITLN
jgi:multisubunit Na+/H+ antiporter MnhE subunit